MNTSLHFVNGRSAGTSRQEPILKSSAFIVRLFRFEILELKMANRFQVGTSKTRKFQVQTSSIFGISLHRMREFRKSAQSDGAGQYAFHSLPYAR